LPIHKYAPGALHVGHVQPIIDKLTTTHEPNTTRNVRACLRAALNFAIKRRYINYNVARFVEMPDIPKSRVVPLTSAQAQALLDIVKGHHVEAAYYLAVVLGLREGEILAIRWQDVDLAARVLRVTGTLRRHKGQLLRTRPKTDNSHDTMPLPDVIVNLLRPLERGHGYVFTTDTGNAIDPVNFYKQFMRFRKLAGLPDTVTFHTLRHSSASFMIANGTHPRVVMEHLRHSQIGITMDTYGHLLDGAHREEMDKIADLFTH
jgi:integrase